MSAASSESVVGQAAIGWLESVCWSIKRGLEIARGESEAERIIGRVC